MICYVVTFADVTAMKYAIGTYLGIPRWFCIYVSHELIKHGIIELISTI